MGIPKYGGEEREWGVALFSSPPCADTEKHFGGATSPDAQMLDRLSSYCRKSGPALIFCAASELLGLGWCVCTVKPDLFFLD